MEKVKTCSKCKLDKPLEYFHKRLKSKDGRRCSCKYCRNEKYNYRRSVKGKIVSVYSDMKRRVTGMTNDPNYIGLPICTKDEFYYFSLSCPMYAKLFKEWEESGWQNEIKPYIDRIKPINGYVLDNIRWITFLDNVSKNVNDEDYIINGLPF